MIAATPASSKRRAMSSAVSSEVSAQPSTATLPSRASRPTATRPGYRFAACLHQRRIAHRRGADDDAVDALVEPAFDRRHVADAAAELHAACRSPRGCARPPARSPACRQTRRRDRRCADTRSPGVSKACACAAGSRLNTVARAMSPCSRRTHRPSFRSMAGNRITRSHRIGHGPPNFGPRHHGFHFRKLAISASPSFWLFSGWNCVPTMLSRADDGGDRPAIVRLAPPDRRGSAALS